MDWNSSNLKHLVSRPECSFGFLYNYNNYDQHLGLMEEKHNLMVPEIERRLVPNMEEKSNMSYGYCGQDIKKKRLSSEQLESLERSFQEEIKLDPDRKLKLSRELGLQPRQIAVWFQNRRARWKAKKLEHLYDSLKQEFDAIFNEKQKLQEEVTELKAILRDQGTQKLVSGGYTEISGDETVESTLLAIGNSNKSQGTNNQFHIPAGCNYVFNVEECNQVSENYNWGNLPSYP